MAERNWKMRTSSLSITAVGLLGVVYSSLTLGRDGVFYAVLFGAVALVGTSMVVQRSRLSRFSLLLASVLAFVGGVGRSLAHGWANPLALALFLLGVVLGWKAYQACSL